MKLKVKRGLTLPLKAEPKEQVAQLPTPKQIALNLEPFRDLRFTLLAKVGDRVKIGEPLVENKSVEGQYFVSPAAGTIKEVRRGLKRRILDIVVDLDPEESHHTITPSSASKEGIIKSLMQGGLFAHMRVRPLNLVPRPDQLPRDIFVNAVETRPYTPSQEEQIKGFENFFQTGLTTLAKLTEGRVHLVHKEGSSATAFSNAQDVEIHQISGPHPAGTLSYAIHKIAPICHSHDTVWTLSAVDVVTVGRLMTEGRYHTERIVAVAGEGVHEERRKFYKTRQGVPLSALLGQNLEEKLVRIISGDPLMGHKSSLDDFLHFGHTAVSVLAENTKRQFLHFFRLGKNKFTATRTYASGLFKGGEYSFTTNQHGEERAFIDGRIYAKVMPLPIPTMMLVKAILAEDFDLAEELGILEVTPEDFALPTFICPSKIEMVDIVRDGLKKYAQEVGHG